MRSSMPGRSSHEGAISRPDPAANPILHAWWSRARPRARRAQSSNCRRPEEGDKAEREKSNDSKHIRGPAEPERLSIALGERPGEEDGADLCADTDRDARSPRKGQRQKAGEQ